MSDEPPCAVCGHAQKCVWDGTLGEWKHLGHAADGLDECHVGAVWNRGCLCLGYIAPKESSP